MSVGHFSVGGEKLGNCHFHFLPTPPPDVISVYRRYIAHKWGRRSTDPHWRPDSGFFFSISTPQTPLCVPRFLWHVSLALSVNYWPCTPATEALSLPTCPLAPAPDLLPIACGLSWNSLCVFSVRTPCCIHLENRDCAQKSSMICFLHLESVFGAVTRS